MSVLKIGLLTYLRSQMHWNTSQSIVRRIFQIQTAGRLQIKTYQMRTQHLLVLVLFAVSCWSHLGVDISQLYSTTTYQCLKKAGYTFAIPRAFCSYGAIDHNAVQNLKNARSAGLTTDIYMFPCRGKAANAQVDELVGGVAGNLYDKIWVDVETNPSSGCSWSAHDSASNCQFLTEVINRIKSHGKTPGIYASYYMWQTIFGSHSACTGLSSHPLWYAHYDGKETLSDFTAFGGWAKPHMKQFQGDSSACGAGIDKNYLP